MNELIPWFLGRPKWLQEAALLLLANGRFEVVWLSWTAPIVNL
jgi:hypothetical protein